MKKFHASPIVLVIRHGQRVDEAMESPEFAEWIEGEARPGFRWYDPPLTAAGREQARAAGRLLAARLLRGGGGGGAAAAAAAAAEEEEESAIVAPASAPTLLCEERGGEAKGAEGEGERGEELELLQVGDEGNGAGQQEVVLYTSTLLRTIETAAGVASQIPGARIRLVPGLAACAAAVVQAGGPAALPPLAAAAAAARHPGLSLFETTKDQVLENIQAFEEAVDHIGRMGNGLHIVVSHREGIQDLSRAEGRRQRLPTPYCCFAWFQLLEDEEIKRSVSCIFRYRLLQLTDFTGTDLIPQQGIKIPPSQLFEHSSCYSSAQSLSSSGGDDPAAVPAAGAAAGGSPAGAARAEELEKLKRA